MLFPKIGFCKLDNLESIKFNQNQSKSIKINQSQSKSIKIIFLQVSHHPPVSACHAFSKNWTWWQDLRVKTKFWGKSMEFQPDGIVHLKLDLPDGTQELYTWNKVEVDTIF